MGWNLAGSGLFVPLSARNAATNNLAAWTSDAAFVPSSPGISAGYLYVCQAFVDQSVAANNAYVCQLTAGSGCANSFIGVYDATTQTLLAQTADISSALNTTQTAPIKAALSPVLTPQPLNKELWLVFLIGSLTSTPTVVGRAPYATNIGQSSHYRFQLSAVSGYSSLPAVMPALTPVSVNSTSQSQPFLAIGP